MASRALDRPLPRRLRKHAAERLLLPLQRVAECWSAGRIRVLTPESDEPRLLPLDALIFAEDQLLFDGVPIERPATLSYALLNKPKFVTSTTYDPDGRENLSPYLREMPKGCFPVGRLDRETSGLLLCTNDGDLANAVLRPDHETTKAYWLWLDDTLEPDDPRLSRMLQGVDHHGQLLAAKEARIVARTEYATELELTLTQGRNHQIRHMCRALQLHLRHLHRSRIGPLSDAGLALGAWRSLGAEEVEALWSATGGKAWLRQRKLAALSRLARAAREAGAPLARLEAWLADEREPG
ncbi:MAG TPA: pseudouridine synthase [Polyangiaceae bacterium]|nr:pseudouridine synthase [Polyangiaceae bacterium]